MARTLPQIERAIPRCTRCPELRAYCAEVAETKRASYRDEPYWGRPVPGFGDHAARLLIVGLAPGAHGANRTGRAFTGDRSGDFLFASLHRVGLATQPTARARDDGLELQGIYIGMSARCAPPANKPTSTQLAACLPYLEDEIAQLDPSVIIALGGIGFTATLRALRGLGTTIPRPQPRFGHGAEYDLGSCTLIGCYHVSQQNTFTGRLTETMLDEVFTRAIDRADAPEKGQT